MNGSDETIYEQILRNRFAKKFVVDCLEARCGVGLGGLVGKKKA